MDTTVTKINPLGTERIGKLILTFAVPYRLWRLQITYWYPMAHSRNMAQKFP